MDDPRRGVREGMKVVAADGEALGEVSVCGEEHFLIAERGHVLRQDLVARYDQVASVEGLEVRVDFPSDEARRALDYRAEGQPLEPRTTPADPRGC